MNAPDKSHRHLDKTPANQSNWYAKLHPIGTAQQTRSPKRLLNLSIFFRIWLAVALVLSICGVVAFTQLFGYVKPTAQQVIEDTLLDTSKLLAATLQLPLSSGNCTMILIKPPLMRRSSTLQARALPSSLPKSPQTIATLAFM